MLRTGHNYASIDDPVSQREATASKRQSRKFLYVMFAVAAALSFIGFALHAQKPMPAPVMQRQQLVDEHAVDSPTEYRQAVVKANSAGGLRAFTKEALVGTQWRFSNNNGFLGLMKLEADGSISGYSHPNEKTWGVDGNGVLLFYHEGGEVRTKFFFRFLDKDGKWQLFGRFMPSQYWIHYLSEVSTSSRAFTKAALAGTQWRFSNSNGFLGEMTLQADGSIAGYSHPNEKTWDVDSNGVLLLKHEGGEVRTRFFYRTLDKEGKWQLHGRFMPSQYWIHYLSEKQPTPSRAFTKASLAGTEWRFSNNNGFLGEMTLEADGSISGYSHPNEKTWDLDSNGVLNFFHESGAVRTKFFFRGLDQDGNWQLFGRFMPSEYWLHYLSEIREHSCVSFAGGPLVKNTKVGEVRVDGKLTVQFKFTIDAGSAFGNIVQVGGHGDDEWPAIFFHNSGSDYVTVQFERQGNSRYYAKNLDDIKEGVEYLLRVDIDAASLACQIYLNGAQKHDFVLPAEFKPVVDTYPVYASGDWNNAAKGSISQLQVCSGGTALQVHTDDPTTSPTRSPTNSPTPAPTAAPTPAPTAAPTPAPTGSPTPAPTGAPTPAPTGAPTPAPTASPTRSPTKSPTRSPTLTIPNGECQLYQNLDAVKLVRDHSEFSTRLTRNMEISFKLTINALSVGWANILHIGATTYERSPGLWLYKENKKLLHFGFNGGQPNWNSQDVANIPIELGVEYDISVQIVGYNAKIFFGKQLMSEQTLEENDRFFRDDVPVYVSDPWSEAADAVVTDLYVCVDTEGELEEEPSLCQEYEGGLIEKNKKVLQAKHTAEMDVEFYVTIDEGSSFGNVIQIGGHGDDEWPAVFFNKGTLPNYLDVQFEKQGVSAKVSKQVEIVPGQQHLLRVLINHLRCSVYLDGERQFTFDVPPPIQPSSGKMPIYASGDWNAAASGTLGLLRVCNGEDPNPLPAPPRKCRVWSNANEAALVRNDAVFTTTLTEEMEVSFSLTINALSSEWANILHIGTTNFERSPGIWLWKENQAMLHFGFNGGHSNWNEQDTFDPPIELNKKYEIRVTMSGEEAKIYMDGELAAEIQLEENDRFYRDVVPVYASDPWHKAADAVVTDLRVCSGRRENPIPAPLCKKYQNSAAKPLSQFRAFNTPVRKQFVVSFKLKVTAVSSEWANIVHVGATNYERSPGVWLYKDNRKLLHFAFNGGQPSWSEQDAVDIPFEVGEEYEIRIRVDGLNAEIFFGDELKSFLQLEENDRFYRESVPVYVSDPWHTPCPGMVQDLKVCTGGGGEAAVCQEYAGGEITKNNKVFSLPYTRVIDVEFYSAIDAVSDFGNIVQLGGHGDDEWPAIFFHSQDPDYLTVQFEKQSASEYFAKNLDVVPGEVHLVRVLIQDLQCTIFLDGKEKHFFDIPERFKPSSNAVLPVYASGNWNNAATGVIGFLRACNGPDPSPLVPKGGQCQFLSNTNGETVLQNNRVFLTATKTRMEVSFKLKVNALNSQWANIIHIGATNYERYPGVWLYKENKKLLHFAFNGGQTNWNTQDVADIAFEVGVEYKIRISSGEEFARIYFDGELKAQLALESNDRFYRNPVPVYASDPWHTAADAIVQDLRVCYFG